MRVAVGWRGVRVQAAAAFLAWSLSALAGTPGNAEITPQRAWILDVPYVPQSGALCGGAALAMVLRFWGEPGVRAEDFADLVDSGQAGIRTGALVEAVSARGWTALPFPGTRDEVQSHLTAGRPVIALLRIGDGAYHYVVAVAWTRTWVILHDPKLGPFQAIRAEAFETAWSGSDRWALLVLPPPTRPRERIAPDPAAAEHQAAAPLGGCDALVEAGVLLARRGDLAEAELELRAARALCPESAVPVRELAGLSFRAEDWPGAIRLAEQALVLDPGDAHAWRLLASSRFLAEDVGGALGAWNHLSEPRNDLTRVAGLDRIRFAAVATQLDLPSGRLLTPRAFRRARRRLAELPAQSDSRLSLRPLPSGSAQVDVTVMELPLVRRRPWDLGRAGLRALIEREVTIEVASPTGNGELWAAGWRWWPQRPRVEMAVAVPAAAGRPGIWRVAGFWERQTYAAAVLPDASVPDRSGTLREERRRTALSFADWIGPDLRLEVGAALDAWAGRGDHLSLAGAVETRWAGDRLALKAELAQWLSLDHGGPFTAGGLSADWSSLGLAASGGWRVGLGLSGASAAAPLALWSGAGTGHGRAPLLRAHPLLDGGVVEGGVFGRTLAHATVERQAWPWRLGPLQLGWALFVDSARPADTGRAGRVPWQVDAGTGLRLRSPGMKGRMRIDAARGFADGNLAVSAGWTIP